MAATEYSGEVVPVATPYSGEVVLLDAPKPASKKPPRGNPLGNLFGLGAETPMHYASAMVAKPVSEIAGLAAAVKNLVTGKQDDVEGFKREVQGNLTYEPKTALADRFIKSDYNPLNMLGSAVHSVSEGARGAAGGDAAGDTPRGAVANAIAEAIPQSLGFIGIKGAKPIAQVSADVLNTVTTPVRAPFNAVGRVARNVVDPWLPGGVDRAASRTLNTAVGPNRNAVVNALTDANAGTGGKPSWQIVDNSAPTAAEVAAPVGAAELSGLQKIAQELRPSEYAAIDKSKEGARTAQISKIAKTDADLTAARSLRQSEAKKQYGAVENDIIQPPKPIQDLFSTPAGKAAISQAEEVAKNQKRPWPKDISKELTVKDAQLIKEGFDDMLRNPERFGIGAKNANSIRDLRTELMDWMKTESRGWDWARTDYAANSSPINRMQVGKELEGALRNTLGNAERPTAFANAVDNAPQTIKRATGEARYTKLDEVLTPNEAASVGDVVRDLARDAQHDSLAKIGTTKARELVGQVAPHAPGVGVFAPKINVMRSLYNRLAGKIEGKTLDRLAQALETPQGTLDLMNVAGIPKSKQGTVINALMNANVVKAGALALPTVTEQQGDRNAP